jgi:hypothetical protein
MKATTLLVLGLAAFAGLSSCGSRSGPEHASESDRKPAAARAEIAPETPVLPLEGLRGVRWIAAPEPRAEGAWYPGEAIGDESAQSVLSSPVGGRVVSGPMSPGHPVSRGEALLEIESPEKAAADVSRSGHCRFSAVTCRIVSANLAAAVA